MADAVLAVATCLLVLQEIIGDDGYLDGPRPLYLVAAPAMTLPLVGRRRAPLLVLSVIMVSLAAQQLLLDGHPSPDMALVAWLVAVHTAAARCDLRRALVGLGIAMTAGAVWVGLDDVFLPIVLFGGAWLTGRLVRDRQQLAVVAEERAAALEREQLAVARAAVAEERTRIARELHDVVAHTLGVVTVLAGGERLHTEPGSTTHETLATIERSGRGALEEMGRLVGMLRNPSETEGLLPQPGLSRLDDLLDEVRAVGLDVQLEVIGESRSLERGLDVSAYRILQEALTNTIRHGSAARARVRISWESGALQIEVADDGTGPVPERSGTGHGLLGIRERVSVYGGALFTGRSDLGGFLLVARLPTGP